MQGWRRNLIICGVGSFLTCCGISLVVPFLSIYIQQLGVKDLGQVEQFSGIAFGITFLSGIVMSGFWGRLADRKGKKAVLMVTSLGLSLVSFLFLTVSNVYVLIFYRFLQGLVTGFMPAATSFVAKEMPEEQVGKSLSFLTTGATAGSLLGPVLGGYLEELLGIRNVFLFTALMLFLSFLSVALFLTERKTETPTRPQENHVSGSFWSGLTAKYVVIGVLVSSCLLNMANQSIEPIVTLYVKQLLKNSGDASGHASLIAGLVVSCTGFGIVLASFVWAKRIDHINQIRVMSIALLIGSGLFVIMGFAANVWVLMLLRFSFGVAQAAILPIGSFLLKKSSDESVLSRVFSYNQAFQYAGLVLGPQLGGFVSSHFGFACNFYVTAAILLMNYGNIKLAIIKDDKDKQRMALEAPCGRTDLPAGEADSDSV